MTETAITFRDLTLGYNSHPAVHHLNGTVRKGSLTALVGQNGSGKSTLLKGIVGVLKPMAGACTVQSGARVAYLPQQSELDRSFPARVIDLVTMGLWPKRGLLGRYKKDDRETVAKALLSVGLEGFESRSIDTLSGGQLQRALFARVLVQDADIILLDEPFNAIDARTVGDLIGVIKHWHGANLTVMVVIHDLELVRSFFPETLLLARSPVAWGETREALRPENLLRARRFDEAWHEDAPWCEPSGHAHSHSHDHHHLSLDHQHHHGHHQHEAGAEETAKAD
jgi:zinc/manganese transport system ATP-binding protein